ncbi:MAG: RNA pseudouridine synthase [Treponema sp.]|nr:RNA pseudouridine synthase [Treponema sp.]MCL2129905.1 RNA pseudouridine synthase [Treponema sp.]
MKQSLFTIIYEDENIAALNKASEIAVSPDRWDTSLERLDRLAAGYFRLEKIFTVHRIDRDTSGLVVFAKNSETHKKLSLAFESRKIKKRYIAVVHGRPSWKETTCDLPLVPDGNKLHHTIIDKYKGKKSFTAFRLLGSAGNYSVLEALPETGRTHQIRVHLASLGHPVVCDELYGNKKPVLLSAIKKNWRGDRQEERPLLSRLGLHAAELFIPGYSGTGDTSINDNTGLQLKAPLPKDMASLIKQMEKAAGMDFEGIF